MSGDEAGILAPARTATDGEIPERARGYDPYFPVFYGLPKTSGKTGVFD
jgi:hypothetical protein